MDQRRIWVLVGLPLALLLLVIGIVIYDKESSSSDHADFDGGNASSEDSQSPCADMASACVGLSSRVQERCDCRDPVTQLRNLYGVFEIGDSSEFTSCVKRELESESEVQLLGEGGTVAAEALFESCKSTLEETEEELLAARVEQFGKFMELVVERQRRLDECVDQVLSNPLPNFSERLRKVRLRITSSGTLQRNAWEIHEEIEELQDQFHDDLNVDVDTVRDNPETLAWLYFRHELELFRVFAKGELAKNLKMPPPIMRLLS